MNLEENTTEISKILIQKGTELLNKPIEKSDFSQNKDADDFLNDIGKFPYAFVLGCVMDKQIKSERAWLIPYIISKELNSFKFSDFLKLTEKEITQLFKTKKLHRFNERESKNFYNAIQLIHNKYDDDASNIWNNNPSSATVVRRFLEFDGIGIKISTMAANILARQFKIKMKDYYSIDISPDRHIRRVFKRIGFISERASNEELIYRARELNPTYPGIFDLSCFEIGRAWCSESNKPKCKECYLNEYCQKNIVSIISRKN